MQSIVAFLHLYFIARGYSVLVYRMPLEAAPDNVGAVSGLILELLGRIGWIAVLGFGAAAGMLGITFAFYVVIALIALAGGVLSFFLPKRVGNTCCKQRVQVPPQCARSRHSGLSRALHPSSFQSAQPSPLRCKRGPEGDLPFEQLV